MNDLINKIFNSYNYIKISGIGNEKIEFYKHKSAKIANYFLVNTIDCRRFEDDEEKVINSLEQLEYEYSKRLTSNGVSLKQRIIESFDDIKEASQVDKNISAIYLLLFKDIEKINH